jgi:hypothetical protein
MTSSLMLRMTTMTEIEYHDRPPAGWFVLEIMQQRVRGREWIALLIDVDPEDYRAKYRSPHSCWVRIAGKHKSRNAAWDALEGMMATRH